MAQRLSSPPTSTPSASASTTSTRCIISLKSKPQISVGISRIEEQEEPIDPALGRQCVAEPWRLLQIEEQEEPIDPALGLQCVAEPWRLLQIDSSEIIKRVKREFKLMDTGNRGKIDINELRIGLHKLGHQIPESYLQALVEADGFGNVGARVVMYTAVMPDLGGHHQVSPSSLQLSGIMGVKVIYRTKELEEQQDNSRLLQELGCLSREQHV